MSIVTINLGNKKFDLSCPQDSHDRLLKMASKLDDEIKKITDSNKHISLEIALVMIALKLMDSKHSNVQLSGGEIATNLETEHQNQLNDLAVHLNKLIDKI